MSFLFRTMSFFVYMEPWEYPARCPLFLVKKSQFLGVLLMNGVESLKWGASKNNQFVNLYCIVAYVLQRTALFGI